MSMKTVLIIAYYFPPSGGPGVQRVLKHCRYLPEFGWRPVVLTVSNGQFPARDESLIAQIPDAASVERSPIFEPYDVYRLLTGKKPGSAIDVNTIKKEGQKLTLKERIAEEIRAALFIPDARASWIYTSAPKIREIFRKYEIDALYSSSPPYTTSLIARNIKRAKNLPWIAGFRDPWTGFISAPKRRGLSAIIDRYFERSVFGEADLVECAWEGIIKDALAKYPNLDARKFYHSPNGYDSADFPDVEYEPTDKFTVTYAGSMYGRRNPASFFEAIESLIDRKEIDAGELRLRFVGRFGAEVEEMFESASFKNSIETVSYVPHEKSVEYLIKSDLLLLVVDESKESEEIVPGKVYEYIGSKKPVLAVAPQSSAIAKLIRETRSGAVAHQSEIEKTAEIFLAFYRKWKERKPLVEPDFAEISQYERRESAKTLALELDDLIARHNVPDNQLL